MNKKYLYIVSTICFSVIVLFNFLACNKRNDYQEVLGIDVYYMNPCWCLELDAQPEHSGYFNLVTEDDIRFGFEHVIEIPGGSKKAESFLRMLHSAKKVSVRDNKVRLMKFNGLEYFWQDGILIDVFYKDSAREKDVYIMQNGKKIFYKKGEEGLYYKMPWQIRTRIFWGE